MGTKTISRFVQGEPMKFSFHDEPDYQKALKENNVQAWYQTLGIQPRAFVYISNINGKAPHIHVKRDALGIISLVAHEIGHALGYDHTWKPTVMNQTGLFRWFDHDNLRACAKSVLREAGLA